jgi:MscS family membrane protein
LNPTAFLTGLGVGGVAVALAAQKTLENVIGGVSLILDRVVHLGDTIALGPDIFGTIEDISLRSTRIRTLDRTVVSVPNGRMANMTLENFSARDSFWLHSVLGLRYGTTAAQIRTAIDGIRRLLEDSRDVLPGSVRVRFRAFARVSFEVEVFAYILSPDWPRFLEIQEGLLLRIAECFESNGVQMAFPPQAVLAGDSGKSQ